MPDLYCPVCGEQMSVDGQGHLICPQVGEWLSPRMNELLPRLAAEATSDPPDSKPGQWGAGWHCVADGRQMEPNEGHVRCPECGRYLPGSVLYELMEFNPHVRYSGETANSRDQ